MNFRYKQVKMWTNDPSVSLAELGKTLDWFVRGMWEGQTHAKYLQIHSIVLTRDMLQLPKNELLRNL